MLNFPGSILEIDQIRICGKEGFKISNKKIVKEEEGKKMSKQILMKSSKLKRIVTFIAIITLFVMELSYAPLKALAASSKTIDMDLNLLNKVGKQTKYTNSCACFSAAYSRTIVENKVYQWSYFDYITPKKEETAKCKWYGMAQGKVSSPIDVYKKAYQTINNNKPMVIFVKAKWGKLSGQHYVVIIGYKNVTSVNSLGPGNFIILDPLTGTKKYTLDKAMGEYTLGKYSDGKYNYYIPNAQNTSTSGPSTLSISGASLPNTINKGSYFDCKGTISSNYTITNVTGKILKPDGTTVMYEKYVTPNSTSYSLGGGAIDTALKFNLLPAGTYYYKVWASDTKATGKI